MPLARSDQVHQPLTYAARPHPSTPHATRWAALLSRSIPLRPRRLVSSTPTCVVCREIIGLVFNSFLFPPDAPALLPPLLPRSPRGRRPDHPTPPRRPPRPATNRPTPAAASSSPPPRRALGSRSCPPTRPPAHSNPSRRQRNRIERYGTLVPPCSPPPHAPLNSLRGFRFVPQTARRRGAALFQLATCCGF
jgi:hypothetical protein